MKELIKKIAKENKISDIGFLKAEKFSAIKDVSKTPFLPECNERENPFLIMEAAKTIIVLAFSYYTNTEGNLSMYARGQDYHHVTKKLSSPILDFLIDAGYKAEFFCDSASLNERYLANMAGLGFIGKNGFLISPEFGSYIFLAHIITNCEISPDKPNNKTCMACGKCIKACPAGALSRGDFYSCLSYVTQKKGELSEKEKILIKNNNTCWGCDICQNVCPHNADLNKTEISEFREDLICNLTYEDISNREFRKKYKNRAFTWRGKGVIDRNLSIIHNID